MSDSDISVGSGLSDSREHGLEQANIEWLDEMGWTQEQALTAMRIWSECSDEREALRSALDGRADKAKLMRSAVYFLLRETPQGDYMSVSRLQANCREMSDDQRTRYVRELIDAGVLEREVTGGAHFVGFKSPEMRRLTRLVFEAVTE